MPFVPSHSRGVALVLLSSAGYGAMAVVAKDAQDQGAGSATLLSIRFVLAAVVLWTIIGVRARLSTRTAAGAGAAPARPRAGRNAVFAGLALGAVIYAGEAGLFYAALTRMDASVTELVLYTYPAMVLVAAAALGMERFTAARGKALVVALSGVVLVLLGGASGALDPVGVALALGSATAYTSYVLLADRLSAQLDAFVLAALVATGAGSALALAGLASGTLDFAVLTPRAWGDAVALALVCTVLPLLTFYAALRHVGPGLVAIVSCAEPVITVGLAAVVLGERLGPVQLAGAALVLLAVGLLQERPGTVDHDDGPSARPTAPAPARALAGSPA